MVDYDLELGFGLGPEHLDLRAFETGTLGDYRVWFGSAHGFRDSQCGEYGSLTYVDLLVVRPS